MFVYQLLAWPGLIKAISKYSCDDNLLERIVIVLSELTIKSFKCRVYNILSVLFMKYKV